MSAVILLLLCVLCLGSGAVGVCAFLLLRKKKTTVDSSAQAPPPPYSQISITSGSRYAVADASGSSYIGQDFDKARGKGKMCDAVETTRANRAAFKFTKDGSDWTIATDCDGDGNYTSFLTGESDLIAARDKKAPSTQRWQVTCSETGCSLKNKKTKAYLGGTFGSPTYTSSKTLYRLEPVT